MSALSTRVGDATYRVLLRALPADVRNEFGDDMVLLFRDHRRNVGGRPFTLISLWMAAAYDVCKQALAMRSPQRRERLAWRSLMRAFVSDLRHGLRLLRRYPATSILAVLTLALGIGANAAIFSVVDSVLLRALPYPEPDRLVMVWEKRPREQVLTNVVSPADYLDWRRMNTSFEHMAALVDTATSVTGDGDPIQVTAAAVGWAFFDILGVRPELGRTFRTDDEVFGTHRVAVLGHGFWQRRYGGDRGIIGRKITLNGNQWEVVGVLPRDFRFIEEYEVWAPLLLDVPGSPPPARASHQLEVYARLKSGVSLAQAIDEMDRIGRQLEEAHPEESRGHGSHVTLMREESVREVRTSLVVLFAAVGFVLLIACVNVANLQLVRAASRRREMAVRAALGASRARLVVQSLVESVSLSLVGGAVGLGVALLILAGLPAVMPERLSVVGLADVQLDARVLLFACALSLATGLLFGLLPALQASKPQLAEPLKEGGRGPATIRRSARLALVIGEVALAGLTLVGAGLVLRSFVHTVSQPLGFESNGRLTVTLSVPQARYRTPEERQLALAELERRLTAVPGVTAIGAVNLLPLAGGDSRTGTAIEGREPVPDEPPIRMHPRIVTPGYFKTIGLPIVRGRGFTDQDDARAEKVVIVSETSARRFWGDQDPVGRRIRFGGDDAWRTVVGVAGNVRHWGLRRAVNPMLYWPQAQAQTSSLTFVLRSDLDPASLTSAVRAQVASFDPNLPLASVRTLDEVVSRSVRAERAQTILMGSFGVLALLLAMIGIHGVMSQLVTVRVPEIGVRMTLGARPRQILGQLLAEGLWQTTAGLALGLAAGASLMTFGSQVLYEVRPWDPITLAAVAAVLLLAGMAACLIPARRAMNVDPAQALRQY